MEDIRDLLLRGTAAAKARSISEARFFLERVLRLNPSREHRIEALYWLSTLITDPDQEREMLKLILAEDPSEPRARRRLLVVEGKLGLGDMIDSDPYKQPPAEISTTKADQYTCPKCGGRLKYSSDGGALECEYCHSQEELGRQTGPLSRDLSDSKDFLEALATSLGNDQARDQQMLSCGGCGAEFLLSERMISATCPFCLSASVVNFNKTRKLIPPTHIVPVEVGFPQAFEAARGALSGELEKDDVQNVRPAFYPVWRFEMKGSIGWQIPVPAFSNLDQVSEEFPVDQSIVAVLGVTGNLENFTEIVQDFDYSREQPFAAQFLADCLAVGYQITLADAALKAREYTIKNASRSIATKIGRRISDFLISSSNLYISQVWLTLVPFWMFIDPITDKMAVVNGQNGHTFTGVWGTNIL